MKKNPKIDCVLVPKIHIPCKKNVLFKEGEPVWSEWHLFEKADYELSKVKVGTEKVSFSLYDEQGWIGDYEISKTDFENNCEVDWKL